MKIETLTKALEISIQQRAFIIFERRYSAMSGDGKTVFQFRDRVDRATRQIEAIKRGIAKKYYIEGYDDGNYDGQVLGRNNSKEAF